MTDPADNTSLGATRPAANASVHASAGTGKTWLLTARIVRLLLAGAEPGQILAVTFTRKAAAEMQHRVNQRLHELMVADSGELDRLLAEIGVTADPGSRKRARLLYEDSLFNPYALKATTFHSFCQDLLQRFPLEAGITPGFQLTEHTESLQQAARDALVAESAADPDGALADALETLARACSGLHNTVAALQSFLAHRSDWWAMTAGDNNGPGVATRTIENLFNIRTGEDPLQDFPDETLQSLLAEFSPLLRKNETKTNTEHADLLDSQPGSGQPAAARFQATCTAFFTSQGNGTPLASRKESATQKKRLGDEGEKRFLELNHDITERLQQLRDRIRRSENLAMNLAWYRAGVRLLAHYQRIKQEQRLLDFADLEWKACELLNHGAHAHWVQYKLDNRINHLLVDEFQDTNPTQWRLLLPLLEELAGNDDRERSVFLVGDVKQSIYGFRRANPALLGMASGWLEQHMHAGRFHLDASRRSAQAIIDCVNDVFTRTPLEDLLTGFNRHTTHYPDMYGRAELLPLVTSAEEETEPAQLLPLRNPLERPRDDDKPAPHYREGQLIADRINALVAARTAVTDTSGSRAIEYRDILILLRQRSNAACYEKALREAAIPYQGADRSRLLDYLEIRDLVALLNLLIAPFDNLSVAQVLRSPVFGLDSESLLPLTEGSGNWYTQLASLAADGNQPWQDIHVMLERWRTLAGLLPVHDLLDRIFHEADLVRRYSAAFPGNLVPRVRASLTRFLELALEIDSGRYPSLPRFLESLERLRLSDKDQPDEATPDESDSNRVRILTIHAAKGLEAPVVFLADTAASQKSNRAWSALVDWPATAACPRNILLTGRKDTLDTKTLELLERQNEQGRREDANILYVALTRARQYLFASGAAKQDASDNSWYRLLSLATEHWQETFDGSRFMESGSTEAAPAKEPPGAVSRHTDPRLSLPVNVTQPAVMIAPSRTTTGAPTATEDNSDGRTRGTAIHRMLDALTRNDDTDPERLLASIAVDTGRDADDAELLDWWHEAQGVIGNPSLARLFNASLFEKAFNEVAVQYRHNGRVVYGILDRLVLYPDGSVYVIDYKTHRGSTAADFERLGADYREQMRLYAGAAARIWPDRKISAGLLFTATGTLMPMRE